MLQDTFSSERHLLNTERHERLCVRNPNAGFLGQDILAARRGLEAAVSATLDKQRARAFAYDGVIFADGNLDNEVQNVFEACRKFDRESGSEPILTKVFPTGRVSDVKEAPRVQEPLVVRRLIERLQALGAEHPLAAVIVPLQARVAESEKALADYDKLGEELALATVQEEIAQRRLRDQYRLNYLHAQEKFGKATAELLFPVITSQARPAEAVLPAEQPQAS
jgi:hypothetical protein